MIEKCQCQHCDGSIEFDAADFEFSSGNDVRSFGQIIPCPHCGMETAIYLARNSSANRAENSTAHRPSQSSEPLPPLQPSAQAANESIFFQSGNVTVTNARFIVGAKTFAMRSVTSVEIVKTDQEMESSRIVWASSEGIGAVVFLTMIALGLFVWLLLGFSFWFAIGFGIVGFVIYHIARLATIQTKTVFKIVLRTAGGDVIAYQSFDRNHISQIVEALNDSIIALG
ncbi:MAG: DUF6232 family protein, partial [Limisphaerales bacterium]